MLPTNKTCIVLAMETMGQRIKRLREAKEWSRARLGREMAIQTGRETAYTGELVRQYELDATDPPADARRGLALALGREESYILYGDSKKLKGQRTDADEFYEKYLALSKTDRQIVDLMLKKAGK